MSKQTKKTVKQHVMEFVESKGSARYMEIIKFIVDHNHGEGTYDASYVMEPKSWNWDPVEQTYKKSEIMVRKNTQRGYYSGAFRKPYVSRDGVTHYPGHFYNDTGYGCLEKTENGSYIVVRK